MTYLLGLHAVRHMVWARAMYHAARNRGKNAATAYRIVARSLLRILTAMLRDGTSYDEKHYVAALKAKGVRWALDIDNGRTPSESDLIPAGLPTGKARKCNNAA